MILGGIASVPHPERVINKRTMGSKLRFITIRNLQNFLPLYEFAARLSIHNNQINI
jgi:hypothetical protein